MEKKGNLKKELDKLAVEGVEIDKSIAEVLASAVNVWKDRQMTDDIVAKKELDNKLKDLERRRKELVKRKKDVQQKKIEVLIKYKKS